MALEKRVLFGELTILPDMRFMVREDTVVVEDAKELSRTFHRVVLNPGDDVSTAPPIIRGLAGLLWTPEVIASWKDKVAASAPKLPGAADVS
jgi:hypothetical protein